MKMAYPWAWLALGFYLAPAAAEVETLTPVPTLWQQTVSGRQLVENYFNDTGKALDQFISQKILRQDDQDFSQSGTRARLSFIHLYSDQQGYKPTADFNINLDLHQSQRHLRLVVKSENQSAANSAERDQKPPVLGKEQNYAAGLEYLWASYQKWQPSLKAEVKWQKNRVEPYVIGAFSRQFGENQRNWQLELSSSYYHSSYTHFNIGGHYYHQLGPKWSWTLDNGIHLAKTANTLDYYHSPSLQTDLTSKTRWLNQIIVAGANHQPTVYQNLTIRMVLTSTIYKDWLVLELEPRFSMDLLPHQHRKENAIYLRLHVLFNKK